MSCTPVTSSLPLRMSGRSVARIWRASRRACALVPSSAGSVVVVVTPGIVVVVVLVVVVVVAPGGIVVVVVVTGGDAHVGSPVGSVPWPLLIAHVTTSVVPGVLSGTNCTSTRSAGGTPRLLGPI